MKPIYMWAGGKTKLLKHYAGILPDFSSYQLYVEPFFGGGAVWADIQGDYTGRTVVNDINTELMGVLRAIRDDRTGFLSSLETMSSEYLAIEGKEARKELYYKLRKEYWTDPSADKLYFLMRLGFNGIWQTCKDSNGLFGTPAGLLNHKKSEQIFNAELINEWSDALQKSSIFSTGYEQLEFDPEGALIYLDPPYRDSFTSYGTGFNDEDQKKLITWAKKMVEGGATVLLANRHVEGDSFFEDLLPDADFHYFDVVYTAGRRKKNEDSTYSAKPAREFLAIMTGDKSPSYVKKQDLDATMTLLS